MEATVGQRRSGRQGDIVRVRKREGKPFTVNLHKISVVERKVDR